MRGREGEREKEGEGGRIKQEMGVIKGGKERERGRVERENFAIYSTRV